MNGLRVRTVSTSLGEWISSGNEWSQSPCPPGEWIHLSWVGHRRMVWKGYCPRLRLVLAGGHASAWFSFFWRWPCTGSPKVPSGLIAQAHEVLDFDSVYIITDNRDLVSSEVESQPGIGALACCCSMVE